MGTYGARKKGGVMRENTYPETLIFGRVSEFDTAIARLGDLWDTFEALRVIRAAGYAGTRDWWLLIRESRRHVSFLHALLRQGEKNRSAETEAFKEDGAERNATAAA